MILRRRKQQLVACYRSGCETRPTASCHDYRGNVVFSCARHITRLERDWGQVFVTPLGVR